MALIPALSHGVWIPINDTYSYLLVRLAELLKAACAEDASGRCTDNGRQRDLLTCGHDGSDVGVGVRGSDLREEKVGAGKGGTGGGEREGEGCRGGKGLDRAGKSLKL